MRSRLEGARKIKPERLRITRQVKGTSLVEVARTAAAIEAAAKARAPFASGELRDSIDHTVDETSLSARVTAHAPHSAYVEFGTRHTVAQPFLFPSLEEQRPGFPARVQSALRKVFGG